MKAPGLPNDWVYGFELPPHRHHEVDSFNGLWLRPVGDPRSYRYRSLERAIRGSASEFDASTFKAFVGISNAVDTRYSAGPPNNEASDDKTSDSQAASSSTIDTLRTSEGPCGNCMNCRKDDCGACSVCRDFSSESSCIQKVRNNAVGFAHLFRVNLMLINVLICYRCVWIAKIRDQRQDSQQVGNMSFKNHQIAS